MSKAEELLNSLTETVPIHTHPVPDTDTYFIIDPYTRAIENTTYNKTVLMRGDHNSERFTFELPRYVDGHDMSLCNRVLIHFDNVGDTIENIHSDVAEAKDLRLEEGDSEKVICSWLIRREATQIVGILSFSLQYLCVEDGEITYEWNTDSYDDIEIRKSKQNAEASIVKYTNVLEEWRAQIFGAGDSVVANIANEGATQLASITAEGETQVTAVKATSATEQEAIELKGSETLASIPDNYEDVYAMAEEALRTKADGVVCDAESEIITIADSSDDYVRGLNLYGKSTQFTTTGKNLFNSDPDNIQLIDKTEAPHYGYAIELPAGTYTISATAYMDTYLYAAIYDGTSVGENYYIVLPTEARSATVTINDGDVLYLYNAITYTSTPGMEEATKTAFASCPIQIEAGDVATDYEPYTGGMAAPNPEYPQEIVSIENPSVNIYGKNLIPYPYNQTTLTTNGITFTANSDGTVTANGTSTDTAYFSLWNISSYANAVPLPKGTYTLSGAPIQYCRVAIGLRKNESANRETTSAYVAQPYTFEVDNDITRFDIICTVDKGTTVTNAVFKPQLEVGTVTTEYEPYQPVQSVTLNQTIHGIPVTSGGNYTDPNGQRWICDEIDLERGVHIHRTKLISLADTSEWYSWGVNYRKEGYTGFYHYWAGLGHDDYIVVCTIAPFKGDLWGGSGFGAYTTKDGNQYIAVCLANDMLDDISSKEAAVESFKKLITDTNAKLLVTLEPTETPLTDEEIEAYKSLKTNYPNTTILNDAGAMMKVKYNADTKLYITNTVEAGVSDAVEDVLNDTY